MLLFHLGRHKRDLVLLHCDRRYSVLITLEKIKLIADVCGAVGD